MKSKYGIPGHVLAALRQRDQDCVYCRVPMEERVGKGPQEKYATIEHLYPPADDPTWVCWCCNNCNASHKKPLREWFQSPYCVERGISEATVAPIIKAFLDSGLKEADQIWLDGTEDRFLKVVRWNLSHDGGHQRVERTQLTEREAKSFDRVVKSISNRRTYPFGFRDMQPGTFGRYYGFMYWIEGDVLCRIPYPD